MKKKVLIILIILVAALLGLALYSLSQTNGGDDRLYGTPESYIGEYVTYRDAPAEEGLEERLWIFEDGRVRWQYEFMKSEPPVVEEGTWSINERGELVLTITGNHQNPYQDSIEYRLVPTERGLFEMEAQYELVKVQG
jgi:hypothetical protein